MFKIAGYIIDLEVTAELTLDADLTEYPAETGSAFHDLLSNQPPVLSIDFIVSNSPTGEVAKARQGNVIPSNEAKAFLESLRDSLEPFTVECSLGTFESVVFAPLTFKRDSDTGAALMGSATFKKAVIRQLRRVVIEQTAAPARRNLGNRPTQDKEAPEFILRGPGYDPPYNEADAVVLANAGHWRFKANRSGGKGLGERLTEEQEARLRYQQSKFDIQVTTNPDGSFEWRQTRTGGIPGDQGTTITRSGRVMPVLSSVPEPPVILDSQDALRALGEQHDGFVAGNIGDVIR